MRHLVWLYDILSDCTTACLTVRQLVWLYDSLSDCKTACRNVIITKHQRYFMIASLQIRKTNTRICELFIIIKMMCSASSNQQKSMTIKVRHQRCSFLHWMDIRGSFLGHRKWPDVWSKWRGIRPSLRPWVSTSVYIRHLFASPCTVFIRLVCNLVGWY